jgi:hypothetical protein
MVWSVATFLLGVVAALCIGQWFVGMLPGPKVGATIQTVRGDTANTIGCLYYVIIVSIEQPVEDIYLKAHFPDQINNYKVGLPQEYETGPRSSGRTGLGSRQGCEWKLHDCPSGDQQ